jgi:hypothetical protein
MLAIYGGEMELMAVGYVLKDDLSRIDFFALFRLVFCMGLLRFGYIRIKHHAYAETQYQ